MAKYRDPLANSAIYLERNKAPEHKLWISVVTKAVDDAFQGNDFDEALKAITSTFTSLTGTYKFTLSEAVAVADGITLSFINQKNYQWPVDNTNKVTSGMIVTPGTNVEANTTVSKYEDITTIFPDSVEEKRIIKNEAPAINNK